MQPKAILMNLSNVVANPMEAYGAANMRALNAIEAITCVPTAQMLQEMKNTPMPGWAYLPGNAPGPHQRQPRLFENNTFYPLDWMLHLPSVQEWLRETCNIDDPASPEVLKVMHGAIEVYDEALRQNLQIFPDFVDFHGRMEASNPDCKIILIPDVKADFTSKIISLAWTNDGTFRAGTDFFDGVFAPAPNPLKRFINPHEGVNHTVTPLPGGLRKPAKDYVDFIAANIGILPADWLVIGEKPEKDGGIVANPDTQFIQIRRNGTSGDGTKFMKQLSDYGVRATVDVTNAGIEKVTPGLVIADFFDPRLAQLLDLNSRPGQSAENRPQPGGMD